MKKRLSLSQKNTKNNDNNNLKKIFTFKLNTCQKEIKINKQFLKKFPSVPSIEFTNRNISQVNSSVINEREILINKEDKNKKSNSQKSLINQTTKIKLPLLDKSIELIKRRKNTRNIKLPLFDKSINENKKFILHKKNIYNTIRLNILSINSEIYIKYPKIEQVNVPLFHEKIFDYLINIERNYENIKVNYDPFCSKSLSLNLVKFFQNFQEISNKEIKDKIYNIFKQEKLNIIYKKVIKCILFVLTVFLFELKHFNESEISTIHHIISSNGFGKIIKELYEFIYLFYSNFFPQKLFDKNILVDKNKIKRYKEINNKDINKTNLIYFLEKKNDKCVNELSNYICVQLKYIMLNPFPSIITEVIKLYEICSVHYIQNIICNSIIFPELNHLNLIYISSNFSPIFKKFHLKTDLNKNCLLPIKNYLYNYSLVLDLDETLIHHFDTPTGGTFFLRPNCINFLKELSPIYEIILFTSSIREYADSILNKIENGNRYFQYRLYREHLHNYYKDLSKLGRDLKKTIIIDNLEMNFKLQPENGLLIKSWNGDDINDMELKDLKELLIKLYFEKIPDIRIFIKNINNLIKDFNGKRVYKNLNIKSLIHE